MQEDKVLYILTASEISDVRQIRFLEELALSAVRYVPESLHIVHHISYHLGSEQSDISLCSAVLNGRYERCLHKRTERLAQMDHLHRLFDEIQFQNNDLVLFCDDDDYFIGAVPIPHGTVVGYQGLQIMPEGQLYDGNVEQLEELLSVCPELTENWYSSVDFSGYIMRAEIAKEYFLSRSLHLPISSLEDILFMTFVDKALEVPQKSFVMHRIWRHVIERPWRANLEAEIALLMSQLDAYREEIEESVKEIEVQKAHRKSLIQLCLDVSKNM